MIETIFANALMCMALNIYHEARNESTMGQLAVGQVVMNRVYDDRFPDNVCDVVKQGKHYNGHPVKNRCQFSWYCDGLSDTPRNKKSFVKSQENAQIVLNGWFGTFTDGATHYHADYVYPEWREQKTKMLQIGNHIFYRWEKR